MPLLTSSLSPRLISRYIHVFNSKKLRSPPVLQNPFGDAKPREQVIAQRVGRSEEDILKDEVKKEKLHVRVHLRVFFAWQR